MIHVNNRFIYNIIVSILFTTLCLTTIAGEIEESVEGERLFNNGMNAYQQGKTHEAIQLLKLAIPQLIRDLGVYAHNTLAAITNLALIYSVSGNHEKALILQEKILKIYKEKYKHDDTDTLIAMNNLAVSYDKLGQYDKAITLKKQVFQLRRAKFGEADPRTLSAMSNLAISYGHLEQHDEALALREKTLALQRSTIGENHRDTLNSMNNLAVTYSNLHLYQKALILNKQTLQLMQINLGEDDPDTLMSMNNLAATYSDLGFHEEALELNKKTFDLRRKKIGEDHPETLSSISNLAISYGDLKQYNQALSLKKLVLDKLRKKLGENHPDTLAALNNLANTYRDLGEYDKADSLVSRIVDGFEKIRNLPNFSIEHRQSIFIKYVNLYQYYTRWYATANRLEEAFNIGDLSKARTLTDNIRLQSALRSLPEIEQIRLQSSYTQAQFLQDQLENSNEANFIIFQQRNIEAHNIAHAKLLADLQSRFPKYTKLTTLQPATVADAKKLLRESEVFISYLIDSKERMQVFVLQANGTVNWVDLGKFPDYAKSIASYRELIHNKASIIELEKQQKYWHEKLITPILPFIKNANHWIISPDKDLALFPLDTLPDVVNHNVSLVQSFTVYSLLKQREIEYSKIQYPEELFAMGNPVYSEGWTPERGEEGKSIISYPSIAAEQHAMNQKLWRNLLASGYELNTIAKMFNHSKNYQGLDASEKNLQDMNASGQLKNYRYLLFSTHGYLAQHAALSALVLSRKNNPEGIDGYVTASEWPLYDLRSDLTVLSACYTGTGKTQAGESVMGLPYALFVAGNKNTLLTLWKVDDEATAYFMERFFSRLKSGISQHEALSQTKQEFVKETAWKHPRFWAAFVLYGA